VVGRRRRERDQVVEVDGGRQRADMEVVVDGLRNHGGSNGRCTRGGGLQVNGGVRVGWWCWWGSGGERGEGSGVCDGDTIS